MIGLLGLLLPWVLLVGGFLAPKRIGWQSAISDYYHTHVGYLFVGIMLAMGAFLICYKGGDDSDENRWTNFGGWMAILVAIFPTNEHGETTLISTIHLLSAGLFLLSTSVMAWRHFPKERGPDGEPKQPETGIYKWSAGIILVCVVLLIAYLAVGKIWHHHPIPEHTVWILETIAVSAFGVAWLIASGMLLRRPSFGGVAQRLANVYRGRN